MTPIMLHQLWSLVDSIQSSTLLNLDDNSLVHLLLGEFGQRRSLNSGDADHLTEYIRTRLPLIRELAKER